MINGRKVFAEKFAPQQVQSTSSSNVVVIGVEQLQGKNKGLKNFRGDFL